MPRDGQDGGNNYYKGIGWYRRHVTVTDAMKGKSLYLRFEAINRKAEIYVNGQHLGSHAGGNSAICLDATKLLHPGDNLLAVKASNRIDQDMPPLQADFTFFGGIYRPAQLIAAEPVHISLSDFGSSGVYLNSHMEKGEAVITVRAVVKNDSTEEQKIDRFQVVVYDMAGNVAGSQGANEWNDPPLKPGESREDSIEVGIAPTAFVEWKTRSLPVHSASNALQKSHDYNLFAF